MNELLVLFLCFLLGTLFGMNITDTAYRVLTRFYNVFKTNPLAPTLVTESKLCTEPHRWVEVPANSDVEGMITITICEVCGFVPSKELMVPQEGLSRINEHLKQTELQKKVLELFVLDEEKDLREFLTEELKNGVDFKKIVQIYNYGSNVRNRFALYKLTYVEHKNPLEGESNERRN